MMLLPASAWAVEIVTSEDATIKYLPSEKSEGLTKGKSLVVNAAEVSYISADGKVPVFLIPFESHEQIKVNLLPAPECNGSAAPQGKLLSPKEVSEYTIEIFQLQKMLSNGKTQAAQKEYSRLVAKYPDIAAIDFVGASISILNGQKQEALARIRRATAANPDYQDGMKLQKALEASGSKEPANGSRESVPETSSDDSKVKQEVKREGRK
jgi:hypothetical protein